MDEVGLDISKHKPWTVDDLVDWEGFNFDLIITLAPEAHHRALEMTATLAADVEYWPTPDPVGTEGRRELQLDAYRATRDDLKRKIRAWLSEDAIPADGTDDGPFSERGLHVEPALPVGGLRDEDRQVDRLDRMAVDQVADVLLGRESDHDA